MASFLPRRSAAERLTFEDPGKRCSCPDWPCSSFWDCLSDCEACKTNQGPLFRESESRWQKTGTGLPAQEVEELRRLSKDHTPTPRAPGKKSRKRKVS